MANAEPASVTFDRTQRMGGLFPDVTNSSPQDVISQDVANTSAGQAPSTFSQTALALANYNPYPDAPPPVQPPGTFPVPAPTSSLDEMRKGQLDLANIRAGGQAPTNGVDLSGASLPSDVQQSLQPEPTQLLGTLFDPAGGRLGPAGMALNPLNLLLPGAVAEQGAARVGLGLAGGLAGQQVASRVLPANTDPLVRMLVEGAAGVAGGGIASAAAPRATSWANAARQAAEDAARNSEMIQTAGRTAGRVFTEERGSVNLGGGQPPEEPFPPLTPEEEAATRAQLEQQQREMQYGGQAAGQVARTPGGADETALRPPEYGQTAEEVVVGNRAAAERAQGSTAPVSPTAPYYDPKSVLLQRIADAKPLQEQNKELLSQFRSRQAGAFSGAAENGPGGEAGFNRALGAMRGQAERVSFQPLRDAIAPEQVASLFDAVTQHPDLQPFEKVQAGTALRSILDGTVPTPSSLDALEGVFPGVTKALAAAKIISGPSLLQRIPTSLEDINNSIRSSNTLLDFAFMGRLGRQAGLMQPGTYARSVGQAWKSLADPEIVSKVWENLDEKAAASASTDKPLPNVATMREDYGLRAFNSDTAPGLLGKIPGVSRAAKVYQNFQALLRPQMLQTEIENRLNAGTLTADDLRNPTVTNDLGRAINLLTGQSSLRIGPDSNLLLEFPNWLAAQGELIFRGLKGGDITGSMARQSLMRLVAFGTATTTALNLAQGKSPIANVKNGVPMASVPGTDLTIDMFGPLGELVSKVGGIGVTAVQGEQKGGVSGAVSGLGKGAFDAYRGLASPLAGIAIDQLTGKNYIGQPISTPGQRITNLIEHVLPFNVSSATSGREPAAQVLGGVGERVHQPSTTTKVTMGNYDSLSPQDKPKGIPQQGWEMAKSAQGAPPELAQYKSYYDWHDAQVKELTPQALIDGHAMNPPKTDKQIAIDVQNYIDKLPPAQEWKQDSEYLKNSWVYENPQLALDLDAKNPAYGKPGFVAGYSLTKDQRALAQAALAQK